LIKLLARAIVGVSAVALSGMALASCGPPHTVLNAVGSDTILDVDNGLSFAYNGSSASSSSNTEWHNTPTLLATGGTDTVPGDGSCASFQYSNPTAGNGNDVTEPPNGSSDGIRALEQDKKGRGQPGFPGCTDIARSSRNKNSTDLSTDEAYAFAKDAVSWARWAVACPGSDAGPVGCAPTNLTQDQLISIYKCPSPGTDPAVTDWSGVGGDAQPIVRYVPQTGSGTLAFFLSKVLKGTTIAQVTPVSQGGNCNNSANLHSGPSIEENTGTVVASGDKPAAVYPYSFAQWTCQDGDPCPALRNGSTLGQLNGVTASATSINNGTFVGRRWVFHILNPNHGSYSQALKVVGVQSSGNGWLCADTASVQQIITNYGFIQNPLGPAGSGLPNSRCRKNPADL
jgi:phosphate transport system substrate-binding protein